VPLKTFPFKSPSKLLTTLLRVPACLPAARVFTGKYFGSRVAVKVLEDSAVHKR
jgi:hypothetical protein